MANKTDLNVTPYYDDYDEADQFHRVLFRPGFAVQARELTQLQTILQQQIERFGRHLFEEGTVVIPGQIGYDDKYAAVKLQSSYSSGTVADYLSTYVDTTITGATSGVKARVVGYAVATTDDPDTLFIKYIYTGTDNTTTTFADAEDIESDANINALGAGNASATTAATTAAITGSAATVQEGIFFVRGSFVQALEQTLVLDKYTNTPSYRVGFTVTETLVTPENDSQLLDNATGSTNYAAKGAHRLKFTLTLAKKTLTDTDDTNFIELMRIDAGALKTAVNHTKYSEISKMIARRTSDESGDYIVRPFSFDNREHLDSGANLGIYTAANGGDASKWALGIGPGKAYVQGREVETIATKYISLDKPRTTKSINNDNVPFNLGNYVEITNLFGQPDISDISADAVPFKTMSLYNTLTATDGVAAGTVVGHARARTVEYLSGTLGNDAALYKLYLFDINMLDLITMSGAVTLAAGVKITGATSGATAIVYAAVSAATAVTVIHTTGTFQAAEQITSSSTASTISGSPTISSIALRQFTRDVKQVFMAHSSGAGSQFSADVNLNASKTLIGTYRTETSGTDNLIGVSGFDTSEAVVGDVLTIPTGVAGATEDRVVDAITATAISFTAAPSTDAITTANIVRKRFSVKEQEELITVYKLPKDNISTLLPIDTTYSVRKQFIATSNGAGVVALATGSNDHTFDAYAAADYTCTILTAGDGSGAAGDVVPLTGKVVLASPAITLEITDDTIFGDGAEVKVTATLTKATSTQKTKTANVMQNQTMTLNDSANHIYGQRVGDIDISLGYADVYKLHAVYESLAIGTSPTLPTLATSSATGSFTAGEIITGSVTGATGRVIAWSSPNITYVVLTGTFTTLDQVTGGTSGIVATVTSVTASSLDVTSRYSLDTGQRDSYYDISRIIRKPGALAPTGRLTIIYDYFTHGTGDYFSVDSYGIAYADIPEYNATKVDPETLVPKGLYPLRDCLDFRPRVADVSTTGSATAFTFASRVFEGTGSSANDMVKADDNVRVDYSFYLPRKDILYLTEQGAFEVITGVPSENPVYPDFSNTASMRLASLQLSAYGFKVDNLKIFKDFKKRYTMGDIGRLERRIKNLEYYTTLGLLERETQSFQIQNSDGLDRFKSGYIVDNFYGHNVGDSGHVDYNAGVDAVLGHLRPKAYLSNVLLSEENTTDTQRTADGYAVTGDLITLPYTHHAFLTQPYATRVESVNPFQVTLWIANITLDPETDVWIDTERVPSLTIDIEGNYENMMREHEDSLGEHWGEWETIWTGTSTTESSSWWSHDTRFSRAIVSTEARERRTGTDTRLVESIDTHSTGDRLISNEIIPWMRTRDILVTAKNMKPNSRVYAFFDEVDVQSHIKPTGTSAQSTTISGGDVTIAASTLTVASTTGFPSSGTVLIDNEQIIYTGSTATTFTGLTRGANATTSAVHSNGVAVSGAVNNMPLITSATGSLSATFALPNTTAIRFQTGKRQFRLTDSSTNSKVVGVAETTGQTTYEATGHLETKQEVIMAVRNATIEVTDLVAEQDTTLVSDTTWQSGQRDPLAQSIFMNRQHGAFLTKVDVFFSAKDATLPVTLDLRTMVNGYPTQTVIPFSTVVKEPADVNISSTAETATTFTFSSPVYIQDQQEFCIVLVANTKEYKVWISRMGEIDVGGVRSISEQADLGSLFKSQNASTWSPSQYEDLKFTAYRALFDTTTTGQVAFTNEELTASSGHIDTLVANSLQSVNSAATVKVNHKNHGMHSTSNNVTLAGIVSDIGNTALNDASGISNSDTSIVCDDISLFPAAGTVKMADEIITYTGKTSTTTLTGCTRGTSSTTAVTHEDNSVVELYMFAGIPLTELNTTHTGITGIEPDSYIVTASTSATSGITGGGSLITATRNVPYDTFYPMIQTLELPNTTQTGKLQSTTGTTNTGSETSFALTTAANAYDITLNQTNSLLAPAIICSQINETNELSGSKSFRLVSAISSTLDNVSPVIDKQRCSVITASNRLNNVDASGNIGSISTYFSSDKPEGDNNAGIYMTKKVTLENPATAIRVILDGVQKSSAEIKVLYKILRTDSSETFDDLGWTYFNTTGVPDTTTPNSKDMLDFKERVYSAGVLDDGTGTALDEFVAFSIKIVMQGTNSSEPPLIKDFRAIALAA